MRELGSKLKSAQSINTIKLTRENMYTTNVESLQKHELRSLGRELKSAILRQRNGYDCDRLQSSVSTMKEYRSKVPLLTLYPWKGHTARTSK